MTIHRLLLLPMSAIILMFALAACTPEVGSDEWCIHMKEKPKEDWTASESGDYAKHCLL